MCGSETKMVAFKVALLACVTFIQVSSLPISERHTHPSPLTQYGAPSPYFRPHSRYPQQTYSRYPYSPHTYSSQPYSYRPQRYRSKPVFDPYTRRYKFTPSDPDRYNGRGRSRGRYRFRDDYRERDYYGEDEGPRYERGNFREREENEVAEREGGRGSSGAPSEKEEEHDHEHDHHDEGHDHELDHEHDFEHHHEHEEDRDDEIDRDVDHEHNFRAREEATEERHNHESDRERQNSRGSGSSGFNQERRDRPNPDSTRGSGESRQDSRGSDSSRFRTKYDRYNVDEDRGDSRQETRGSGFRSKFDRDNLDENVAETQGSGSSGGAEDEYDRNRQLFEQQRDSRRRQDQERFGSNDQNSNRNFGGQEQKQGSSQESFNQDIRGTNQESDQRNRLDYVFQHQKNAGGSSSGSGSSGSSNFAQSSRPYQGGSSQRQSQRFDLPSSSGFSLNQNGNQRRDRESESKTTFNLFRLDPPRQPKGENSNVKKFHYDKTQSFQMAQEAERKEQEAEKRQQDFEFFNLFGDDPFQFQRADPSANDFNPPTTTYRPLPAVEPNPSVFTGANSVRSESGIDNNLDAPVSPFQPSIDDRESCPTEANWEINGKKFLITALEPRCPHMSWSDAVDFCRKSARMQAVSFQLEKKRQQIQAIMALIMKPDTKMDAFWTAGVVSHPMSDRDPILVEWSTGKEEVRPGTKYWARTGLSGLAQPDNYFYRTNPEEGLDEACAAVHRDATGQPKLHDELCTQKYPVVCETSYAMPGDMMGGMLS